MSLIGKDDKGRRVTCTPSWWFSRPHRTRANLAAAVAAVVDEAERLGDLHELRVTQREGIVVYGDLPPEAAERLQAAADGAVAVPRALPAQRPREEAEGQVDAPARDGETTPVPIS